MSANNLASRHESPDELAIFKTELLAHLPTLRAFARSLSGDPARADDLVQEALLKAWANRQSYAPGSNMKAWLFTILRNGFYSELRRRKREREDPDGVYANRLAVDPDQQMRLHMRDLRRGLALLPAEQREAIILVSAGGCEYEEAAGICGCPVGTIKSRVSRARRALLAYFESTERADSMTTARHETAASSPRRPGAASRDDASGP